MLVSGYTINEKIFDSERSLVYRGQRESDQHPVILKILRQDQISPDKIARFQREYEIMNQLRGDGCIQVYDQIEFENSLAIILEDFGGQSISSALNKAPLPLQYFLPLAIRITQQLGDIHNQNLIHKDINPGNIVWNQETDMVKIIDFGLATALSRENPEIRSPNMLEGTLAYISPEQSGRMNRSMDYRSDFYSLGVTFYEMVTGKLPFLAADPMEIVHAHLARLPVPPIELNPRLPVVISDIILRLMSKNAEDRYQSAFGLRRDLEMCWDQWQSAKVIEPFPLGAHDLYARFQLPQKLYGRSPDRKPLLDAFNRTSDAAQGQVELILVTGQAGVGKSSLIHELYKPITAQRGNFIQGKYDQLLNTPYAPLIAAFDTLIQHILTESEVEVEFWRSKLGQALGNNGQVIIDVIPSVQLIIGTQPAVPDLPPAEAENRFNITFLRFIDAFAQIDHPLVLFLDDWQWMDSASRHLLETLLTISDARHLLVIGAYRDDEMPPEHPVWKMLDNIKNAGVPTDTIVLDPLKEADVNQFVADALHISPLQTQKIGQIIYGKTGGNPFFVGEFLKTLHSEGLFSFNYEEGVWEWDIAEIQEQEITDNVISLMMANIQKLDEAPQKVLMLAACIGNRFDLETLALAFEKALPETAVSLWEALAADLVLPLDEDYNLATIDVFGYTINTHYKFAHDRIQQAAYALIPDARKPEIHWQLGRHLLETIPAEEQENKRFTIINHLNLGCDVITTDAQRLELAQLNLEGGKKASQSAAYQPAFAYLEIGLEQLTAVPNIWADHYDLALELYTAVTQAAYSSSHYNAMEKYADTVLANAHNLLDTIPIYQARIDAYTVQNRMREAIDTAIPILQKLGIKLPPNPSTVQVATAVIQTKLALRGKSIENLLDLPLLTDPEMAAAIQMLTSVGVPAYFTNTQLFALIVLKSVQIYIKHGNHPLSCRVYVSYGLMLCGPLNDIESGYKFGELGTNLVKKLNAKEVKSATWHIMNNHVRFWKENLNTVLPQLLEAYHTGMETGDIQFALFAAYAYSGHSYECGRELQALLVEMETYSKVMKQYKETKIHYVHCAVQQVVANLTGDGKRPYELVGSYYDENITVPQYIEAKDETALGAYHVYKGNLCYLFGEHELAQKHFDETKPRLPQLVGSYLLVTYYFYDSLNKIALVSHNDAKANKTTLLQTIKKNQKQMAKWKTHAPANIDHKYMLVAAELAQLEGDFGQTRILYDQAIELAERNNFLNETALGYELAGHFYLRQGNNRLAQHYLQQARLAYMRWGAQAKVDWLEAQFPQLASATGDGTASISLPLTGTSSISASTDITTTQALDLTSVIKASQALSGEIVLDKLLERLMAVLVENAGAKTGYLLLHENGRWQVKSFWGDGATANVELPLSIINYVARVQRDIVLDDATENGAFTQDPVIQKRQPHSILCLPLINQGELSGILYFENDLATGAFTESRLTILNILATQAAISIENARLYGRLEEYSHTLEQQVEQRTAQLRQATTQAEKAQKAAEEASANKSAFLANMSHELRTPLNAIIGFTRIVKRRNQDVLPLKQIDNLDKVLQSSDHLLNLINTILDIAKIEAGRMDVQPNNFSVYSLVDSCVVTIQPLVRTGVALNKDVAPDLPTMYNDQARIKQILINLLSNAAKFTSQGHITLTAHQEEDFIYFAVIDTGIGVSEEALTRIFEEFQQADLHTRQLYGGTGLGLPISRSLATLLGGDLTATSQLGKGSVFALKVPLQYAA